MTPWLRKFVLVVHIVSSVGWIGAVAGYLALDVAAAFNQEAQTVRAAYLMMRWSPAMSSCLSALASLLTGLVISLGTKWGLFRHYWALVSLLLTVFATTILLLEMQTITFYAAVAADPTTSGDDLRTLGNTLPHSIGGTVVLLVITVLNVYKPRGLTPYGWRKQQGRQTVSQS